MTQTFEQRRLEQGAILAFTGPYEFLSNFYPAEIQVDGLLFPSVEHAYQAYKTEERELRMQFTVNAFPATLVEIASKGITTRALTPAEAKKRGRKLPLRGSWDQVKDAVMFRMVLLKFLSQRELFIRLVRTKNRHLEEGNSWGDLYWGTMDGAGQNKLGKILMQVRDILKDISSLIQLTEKENL